MACQRVFGGRCSDARKYKNNFVGQAFYPLPSESLAEWQVDREIRDQTITILVPSQRLHELPTRGAKGKIGSFLSARHLAFDVAGRYDLVAHFLLELVICIQPP